MNYFPHVIDKEVEVQDSGVTCLKTQGWCGRVLIGGLLWSQASVQTLPPSSSGALDYSVGDSIVSIRDGVEEGHGCLAKENQ